MNVDIRDGASEQIAAIHAATVRRARELGVPATSVAPSRAVLRYQHPLQMRPSARGFADMAISNYVDRDPSSGLLDFACGARTYDGHAGTDMFLWPYHWNMMDRGELRVVAARPGVIVDRHDGEFDRQCTGPSAPANYVVIRHDDGLLGYYWHLRNGSVTTKPAGASVALGEVLGLVGSSGFSTGPHLHFELRTADASGTVDPYAGACNVTTRLWTHQAAPIDPAVVRVASHSAPPPSVSSNCDDPDPGYANNYQRNSTVYGAVYLRDQTTTTPAIVSIVRPDGSIATSFTTGTPPSGFWSASYWWTSYAIPGSAPLGVWKIRANFRGKRYEHAFWVGPGQAVASITAKVNSPTRAVAINAPSHFNVTLTNIGPSRAIGCRLSLSRPIRANVSFRATDNSFNPAGSENALLNIEPGRIARARLTIVPGPGFLAQAALFPVVAKCTNTDTAAFAPPGNQLALTGP